jgi:hypothetical protein
VLAQRFSGDRPGNFDCTAAANGTVSSSWELYNNTYHTPLGNATLPCGVPVNDAAASAAAGGSGAELGSKALPMPSDDELIAFAKQILGMD